MRLHRTRARKITSRLLVPALVLWLGGAGFLNCCAGEAKAARVQTSAEESQAAATIKDAAACSSQEHCRKEFAAQALANKAGGPCGNHQRSDEPMLCCARAGQTASPARKARLSFEPGISQTASHQPSALDEMADELQPAGGARLPDDCKTYLRHCVLLI